jgi:hypothetical protein
MLPLAAALAGVDFAAAVFMAAGSMVAVAGAGAVGAGRLLA